MPGGMRPGGFGGAMGPGIRRGPAPPPQWLVTNRILDPDVRNHFLSLYDRGLVRPGDLEAHEVLPFLQGLPKPAAAFALDEFGSLDHAR